MRAQELRDLRAARDDLERRVHDLKLTRQVTMQSLPSIRLVQENDKSLVDQDQLDPGQHRAAVGNPAGAGRDDPAQSREAAEAVRDANDLTNELLKANAENLQQANRSCARRWSAASSTSRR